MAVTYTFSANTQAKASEVNADFTYLTNIIDKVSTDLIINNGAGATNIILKPGNRVDVNSPDGASRVSLYGDNTNFFVENNEGDLIVITPSSKNVVLRPGNRVDVMSPSNTDRLTFYHDETDGYVESTDGDIRLVPAANGDKIVLYKHPRDNSGSASYQNAHIQSGWGYMVGSGTATMNEAVTFPVAFSSDNIRVIITRLGARATADGTPDDEGWFTSVANGAWGASSITTTGFTASAWTEAAATFANTFNFGYAWIAIGPV